MPNYATSATTRSTRSLRAVVPQVRSLVQPREVITSPETLLRYRIERMIGQGGYGQVFLARREGRSARVPDTLCVKVSPRMDGWLREAYFGQLLGDHPRAIAIYDAFPMLRPDGQVLYCLALEYAAHGDLSAYLHRTGRGWPERMVRREIAAILGVLRKLHRGQLLHRDLTPLNVFVCDGPSTPLRAGPRLKLGDFGIVRQQTSRRGVDAHTLNPLMVPSDIFDGAAPKWQSRDDVYQVGQLIAMLVKGDASARIRTGDVRGLPCGDHLKEIIYRCIGERRKRYESADELIDALCNPPAPLKVGILRTLRGVHLAFTGILSTKRTEAARAAKRAGAIVHGGPSAKTTVVVRGRPNRLQAAGRDAGRKLMDIKRLREKGHRITLLNEQQFWRLVGRAI